MKQRIFVDMDGVLAEFNHVDTLETLYQKGYFLNLSPIETVVDAVRELSFSPKRDVYILSAYLSDSKYAFREKNEWIDKYLPFIENANRLFLPCGMSKISWIEKQGFIIGKSDILLDDFSKNLHEWKEAGTGIKLLNGINGKHGTWKGASISIDEPRFIGVLEDLIDSGRDVMIQKDDEMEV